LRVLNIFADVSPDKVEADNLRGVGDPAACWEGTSLRLEAACGPGGLATPLVPSDASKLIPAMVGLVVIARCAASRTLHEACSLGIERRWCRDVAPMQEENIPVKLLK
jgi:hypothetical protein